jgi:antirestriction protein ArdC
MPAAMCARARRVTKSISYKSLEIAAAGEGEGEPETRRIPMLKEFTVFHVSQVEGCSNLKGAAVIDGGALPADTQEFVSALGAHLVHGGDRACYSPIADRLAMPWARDFRSENDYRATLYHELVHWTGHKSRNDRPIANFFGTADYAREELVAEMGGAFLCAEFGLEYQTQHASYLTSWLKVLKEDKRAILKAASQAQKAIDFMRAKVLEAAGEPAQAAA